MGATTSRLDPSDTPLVAIPGHGQIRGTTAVDTALGKPKAHRYTGVPYALPPVGARRWRKPCPLPESFRFDDDARHYMHFGDVCPQPGNHAMDVKPSPPMPTDRTYSEDCLLLNIWVPAGTPPSAGFPVLFFIHGGWLQVGNPHHDPLKDASDLVAPHELGGAGLGAIIVAPGYRLGVFGFLAMECMPAGERGNFGFWDQRLALEWTHANIAAFGGDPTNITLGGLSAGAHSAHSQALYEYGQLQRTPRKPLFRRLFLQSNAAMVPAKTLPETVGQTVELCARLGISPDLPAEDRLDELRTRNAEELVHAVPHLYLHTFRAVRGKGEFVDMDWSAVMLDGRFGRWCKAEKIDIVLGECANEETVYRAVNTPTGPDLPASMHRQLHNYYPPHAVDELLTCYQLPLPSAPQKDWADVFGIAAADSQVYASERLFVETLLEDGPSVLRYHIAYRPAFLDRYSPADTGVGHSFDDALWWFSKCALLEADANGDKFLTVYRQWLSAWAAFVRGDADAVEKWYGSEDEAAAAAAADVKRGRAVRTLGADLSIRIVADERWTGKADVVACIRRIAEASGN